MKSDKKNEPAIFSSLSSLQLLKVNSCRRCPASDQKTDLTVLAAVILVYDVKKSATQQDPWLRR
jgi:hypothetical protein